MSNDLFKPFQDLLAGALDFVTKQKGVWDHPQWQTFLSDMQKKGIEISEDFQNKAGNILESLRRVYESVAKTRNIENELRSILDKIIGFVKANNGSWDHKAWESLINDIRQSGVNMTEETKNYIGGVLESVKGIYPNQAQIKGYTTPSAKSTAKSTKSPKKKSTKSQSTKSPRPPKSPRVAVSEA